MRERVVLHADMDAFYASVEQRDHPEYRGKPVIIGATSARGVVSAASYEARKYGVRSAMPGFRARQLCPNGIFLSGDMRKYQAESRRIHGIFARFTDLIEPLALDEAFLDITGSLELHGPPLMIGQRLRAAVREECGLSISVGIGPNKLVAKIATGRGKPDGLVLVRREEAEALLAPLPVRALFGIGPKTEARLLEANLRTLGQLAHASLSDLVPFFGKASREIRDRARGIDERPVVGDGAPKSVGEESTFETDVLERRVVESALTSHAETVAARLRRSGFAGRTVAVKVKLGRRKAGAEHAKTNADLFPLLSRQMRLPDPTNDGATLARAALVLWERLRLEEPVRLLGVSVSDLEPERAPPQLDLFDGPRPGTAPLVPTAVSLEKSRRLNAALDGLNARYGTVVVHRGGRAPEKLTTSDRIKAGALAPSEENSAKKR